jgi:hypothetical protein
MIHAPLGGWREVYVGPTGQRTALDNAEALRIQAEDVYPGAAKIVLVQDNLDTHAPASLYKVFPPQKARKLVKRFEWRDPPKHGSWLNMAENEIGIFTRTVLRDRIGSKEEFCTQSEAGCQRRTARNLLLAGGL